MSKPTLNLDVYNQLLVDWGKEKGILFSSEMQRRRNHY